MAKHRIKYSDDMSVCAYDGFTVTNMAIQLAIYMGFSKIYIIGADCDYSQPKIHFIEVEDDKDKISGGWLPAANDLGIEGYKAMKSLLTSTAVRYIMLHAAASLKYSIETILKECYATNN